MSDELDLDAIEARCEAATRGPWFEVGPPWNDGIPFVVAEDPDPHYGVFIADLENYGSDARQPDACNEVADAAFIASARSDVPALVAALKDSRGEVERLRGHLAKILELRNTAYYGLYPGIGGPDVAGDHDTYVVVEGSINAIGVELARALNARPVTAAVSTPEANDE